MPPESPWAGGLVAVGGGAGGLGFAGAVVVRAPDDVLGVESAGLLSSPEPQALRARLSAPARAAARRLALIGSPYQRSQPALSKGSVILEDG